MTHMTMTHDDALITSIEIDGFETKRILVDVESSRNILFLYYFKVFDFPDHFYTKRNQPTRAINLSVVLGEGKIV